MFSYPLSSLLSSPATMFMINNTDENSIYA